MRNIIIVTMAAIGLSACPSSPNTQDYNNKTPSLFQLWEISGLDSPESVIPEAKNEFLFVSNVNGDGAAKDGNGYISIISAEGDILDKNWVIGLNGPKGMALNNGKLYVSDIDRLVVINIRTGEIENIVEAPGAGFLNDAALTDEGVLVSDSANARIYKFDGDTMTVFVEDDRLQGINGLWQEGNKLLITTMTGGELLSMDLRTQNITSIAGGMENADSIVVLPSGNYLTSAWPGQIFHVETDGTVTELMNTQEQAVYQNDGWLEGDVLYMPHWQPGTLTAHKLEWREKD